MLKVVFCILFTLLRARIASVIANRAQTKTLNRVTGVTLILLGAVVLGVRLVRGGL